MIDIKVDEGRAMGTAGAHRVLGGLVLVGLALGGWLVADPRLVALPASMGSSLLWLVGGIAVYPTQEFTADALWAGGLPVLVAVATAAVAAWAHRAERRAATF